MSELRPNILLIMTDDQPYYTLGGMDGVMNRLVARGVRFANGYVGTPICGPARGEVLTGKWSHRTGLIHTEGGIAAFEEWRASSEEGRSVLKRVADVGYTLFFGGKFTNGLENARYVAPGVARWFAQLEPLNHDEEFFYSIDGDHKRTVSRGGDWAHNETGVLAGFADNFIRTHRTTNGWFACVWPHAPHGPYFPLDRYKDDFRRQVSPTEFDPDFNERDVTDKDPLVRRLGRDATSTVQRERHTEYRGKKREIEEVDDLFVQCHDALVDTNQLERTYIFFVTDNGYEFGGHRLDKKNWPYEDSTRTPYVVAGPDVRSGVRSPKLVTHLDLAPTICTIAGGDTRGFDGRNLMPILRGDDPSTFEWRTYLMVEAEQRGWHSVRNDRFLYVLWNDGFEELYDYQDDPYQLDGRIVTAEEQAVVEDMRQRLAVMKSSTTPQEYKAAEV